MEGDAEAEVIPVDLQKDWYCIFICSKSTGPFFILYILLNDFTSLSLAAMFFPPHNLWSVNSRHCCYAAISHSSFCTSLLIQTAYTQLTGVSMVTGFPHFYFYFSFQARWPCCAGMWCFVPCVVSYKCKWHDKQSAVKTESVRHHLTHELDPKLIPCFVYEQKACEKGSEGRREEEKRKRESEGYNSYNAVGALSYSEFTLGSHTWCKWTIKLGLTWLSLPWGPGNEPSQPAMLGVLFCTLWIPTMASDEERKTRALGSRGNWSKLTKAFIQSSVMLLMCPFYTWPCGHDSNCSPCLQASQYLQDGPHAYSLHTHPQPFQRHCAPAPQSSCLGSR